MIPLRDIGAGGVGNGAASYRATSTASGQSVSDAVRRGASFVFAGIGMCLLRVLGGMVEFAGEVEFAVGELEDECRRGRDEVRTLTMRVLFALKRHE